MSPRSRDYLRPFLTVRRETTVTACDALDLPVWHDPHNEDERYQSRFTAAHAGAGRRSVKGVVEALARTASLVRQDVRR